MDNPFEHCRLDYHCFFFLICCGKVTEGYLKSNLSESAAATVSLSAQTSCLLAPTSLYSLFLCLPLCPLSPSSCLSVCPLFMSRAQIQLVHLENPALGS